MSDKHIGGTWFAAYGSIYSLLINGDVVRVAMMDRNESGTSPVQRDRTVDYIVDMQNFKVGRRLTDEELQLVLEKIG